ncbi:protein PIEZO homolog [Aricia agestis]|uniref:protein PIEZO homolog n=1 Tax=Aricia agestis TaxID=91739 RepID=UPI001C205472|nr:protein PIEZO homolog [Aricia agestis]
MRAVAAFVLVTVLSLSIAEETTSKDKYEDQQNIIETKPSARLDPYIRKALLKALSDLEENASVTTDLDSSDETTNDGSNTDSYATETGKENIKIHSFIVNGQEAFAQGSNTSPFKVDKKISILSSTAGNVENVNGDSTLPTKDPFTEILQARETAASSQQVRSIQSTPKSSTSFIKGNHKYSNFKPFRTSTTTSTTTTTTTTTTTPKPTHNDDGENIEEVDKKDVQVYQAPLVAAFTVQQDANGVPKNVFPIYQQINNNQDLKLAGSSNFLTNNPNKGQNDYISLQLSLQRELEEKQRILEEQLKLLQFHQRQQEQILRQQQLLIQQKDAQRQQQLLLEQEKLNRLQLEQQRNNANLNNFQPPVLNKPVPNIPIPTNNPLPLSSQVSIQKSVTLDQSNIIANQQQLPNREAVDFLLHLRNQQQNQFPLQQNHLPQGIDTFLRPKPTVAFNQATNLNQLTAFDDLPQRQSNRVFRQESGVGNFGNFQNNNFNPNNVNNNFNPNNVNNNRFNNFNPNNVNNNRFFPGNRPNQFNSDYELKQLLAQRGIHGRAQEDLNIVSKVLSLNHGVPVNRPFDSRRHIRSIL